MSCLPNGTLDRIICETEVVVIPCGTHLHIWDSIDESVSRCHFVSTSELNMVIKRGHGPMFGFIKECLNPMKRRSLCTDDFMHMMGKVPGLNAWVDVPDPYQPVINEIACYYTDADIILMAAKCDGLMAVKFLNNGNKINYMDLLGCEC